MNDLKRMPTHKYIEYYSSALNTSLAKTPDHTRVDLSVVWSNQSEKVRIRAFVDNVFDEDYLLNIDTRGEDANWAQYPNFLYPRFYGVELRWAFGG